MEVQYDVGPWNGCAAPMGAAPAGRARIMVATIMSMSKAARAWGRRTLIAAIVAAAPLPAAAGVRVALQPANSTVAPGSEFDLSMEVTEAGSNFNGFDAYIGYDPAAL